MTVSATNILREAASVPPVEPVQDLAPAPAPVTAPVPVSATIQADVRATSEAIRQELSGINYRDAAISRQTGAGAASATGVERDLAGLSFDEIRARYSPEVASDLIANLVSGANQVAGDRSGQRSTGGALLDTGTDVVSGAVGGIGGIGAVVLGAVNARAGVAAARAVNDATEWFNSTQTTDQQARRRVFEERNRLHARDNAQLRDIEAPADGDLSAGVSRIYRDARDTLGEAIDDPTMAASIISNAVGSFISAGVAGKSIRIAGEAIAPVLAHAGPVAGQIAARTPSAGTLGIGLTEAAGGYQGVANDISRMTPQQLREGSQHYRDLMEQGLTHEDARTQVANRTGLIGAALTAPVAIAAGRLVDKFQMNPLRVPNLMQGLQNIGKETIEEAVQGGAGQIAQNFATRLNADSTKSLTDGVGEQVGLGALGGFGAAGVMQSPGMAGQVLRTGGRAALVGVDRATTGRAAQLRAANDANSPVADAITQQALTQVQAEVQNPETETALRQAINEAPNATPESQAQGNTFVDQMKAAITLNPSELDGAPPAIMSAVDGATDKLDLIGKLLDFVEKGEGEGSSKQDLHIAAAVMTNLQAGIAAEAFSDPESMSLPDGTPGKDLAVRFVGLLAQARQSPGYLRAMGVAEKTLTEAQAKGELSQDITPETLSTPEGQQAAQVAAAAAIVAPDGASSKTVNQMLAHSVSVGGAPAKLKLSPAQIASLRGVKAILDGNDKATLAAEALGHTKPVDRVSKEVLTAKKGEGKPMSAMSQAKAVADAMRRGDVRAAKLEMRGLQDLVRHMKNKVGAFNQHFEQGGGANVPYKALSLFKSGEKWPVNKQGHGVHPDNANSVEQAQRTALEAQRLVDIYNGIREGFPELDVPEALAVELNPLLMGKPVEVAAEFASGKRVRPAAGSSAPPTPAPQGVPVSRVSTEQAKKLTPAGLKARIDAIKAKDRDTLTGEDDATLELLENEQADRAKVLEEFTKRVAGLTRDELMHEQTELTKVSNKMEDHERSAKMTFVQKALADLRTKAKKEAEADVVDQAEQDAILAENAEADKKQADREAEQELDDEHHAAKARAAAAEKDREAAKAAEEAETIAQEHGTLREAFPDLLGAQSDSKIANQFLHAFKFPKEKLSRIMGMGSPLRAIRAALRTPASLKAFLEDKGHRREMSRELAAAYATHLSDADPVLKTMRENLQKFLDKRFAGGDLEKLAADPRFTSYYNMKALNITEVVDGKIQYNQHLLEGAVLAGMQWLLTGKSMGGGWMDLEALSEMLGITEDAASGEGHILEWMNHTTNQTDATQQLADKITEFWGLRGVSSVDDALVKGIPEAVAKEMIRAMVEHGLLVPSRIAVVKRVGQRKPGQSTADVTQITASLIEQGTIEERKDSKPLFDGNRDQYESAKRVKGDKETEYTRLTFPEYVEEGDTPADQPLMQDMSLIERVVLTQPKDINYFPALGDVVPQATHQMNNPMVENTADDLKSMENASKVEFKANLPLVELYTAMEEGGAVELYGHGDLAGRHLNKNHERSMAGKNLSIQSAHLTFMGLVEEMKAVAKGMPEGMPWYKVAVNFAFNISKVGRLQMLGRFSPQASKYVRELLTSTWATLDLKDNEKHQRAFQLALGQALGVKVQQIHLGDIYTKTDEKIDALRPAIEILKDFHSSKAPKKLPMSAVQQLKEIFQDAGMAADLTPVAIHALMEYGRMELATDLSAFETSLSLEADGVTNGLINAINLMTVGEFTEQQLMNMAKGGRFLLGDGPSSMNEQRSGPAPGSNGTFLPDGNDLYTEGKTKLTSFIQNIREDLNLDVASGDKRNVYRAKQVLEALDAVSNLMEILFPGADVEFDQKTKEITIGRNVMKNPMMISIYGSGNKGIAEKLVGVLADSIYARMSNVAEVQQKEPHAEDSEAQFRYAFFANQTMDDGDAADLFARFEKAFLKLTSMTVHRTREGVLYTKPADGPGFDTSKINPRTFTLSRAQLASLKQNVLMLFVDPMADAIHDALGESVFESGKLIINATQAQSIFLMAAHERDKAALVAQNRKKNSRWTADSFLSQDDQKKLLAGIMRLAPLIKTAHQTFFPAGSIKAEMRDPIDGTGAMKFSTDLIERQSSQAFSYGPGEAGVGAMPGLNIGFGDGRAIQIAMGMGRFLRSTAIFDGVHGPLDAIEEDSQALNDAVYQSWQQNPLAAVHASFSAFMKEAAGEPMSQEMLEKLSRTFRHRGETNEVLTEEQVRERMKHLEQDLLEASLEAQARLLTLEPYAQRIDQMAAANAAFVKEGEVPKAANFKELAAELKPIYEAHLDDLFVAAGLRKPSEVKAEQEAARKRSEAADKKAAKKTASGVGRVDKATGVRVISGNTLLNTIRSGVPEIFDLIRRLKSLKKTANDPGWTVVHGTPAQLQAWSQSKGLDLPIFEEGTKGLTSPAERVIYIATPSMEGADLETIAHEVIHAATFEKVLVISRQLNDPNSGPASTEGEAVLRLRELMSLFLNMQDQRGKMSPATWAAYRDAVAAIRQHLKNTDLDLSSRQALALNEFMAWSLTNQELRRELIQFKVNPLLQLAKDAVALIKKLLFGRIEVGGPGESLLGNIHFNTAIIVRSQPTVQANMEKVSLAHRVTGSTSDRLNAVRTTYARMIGTHLKANPVDRPTETGHVGRAIRGAMDLAQYAMDRGFASMNQQAKSTFVMMVGGLATAAQVDPPSMAKAQELYAHVLKNLTHLNFMTDPTSTDPNEIGKAEAKLDVIKGLRQGKPDRQGRSSLLPVFMALATVDDEFRTILSKIPLPKAEKSERTLDGMLEGTAARAMRMLSDQMAGTSKSLNVQAAIDDLSHHVQTTSLNELTMLDWVLTPAGSMVDKTNSKVLSMLQGATASLSEAAERAEAKRSTKLTRLISQVAHATDAIVNEKRADKVGEGFLALMNEANGWTPITKLIADLVGRTSVTTNVYDMIKQVRSMVSQTRQRYREDLPTVIKKSFTSKLTPSQWSELFHGMGKTDLAALMQGMTADDIFEMFNASGTELKQEIAKLEAQMKPQAGRHWSTMKGKADQLAHHMNTGEKGEFLLRNAQAVARLAGMNGGAVTAASKDPTFVANMDRLISLYAVQGLPGTTKATIHSLARTDKAGMAFTLHYLVGQRKDEMGRVTNSKNAKLNYYKGHLPSLQEQGVSLVVADDSRFSELLEKSYKRVGDYVGSDADYAGPNAIKRGYYLAPVSPRSPYNQGIFQNVHQTASGVEAETGFTDGMVAGRILSPRSVHAITRRIQRDGEDAANGEHLMPIFNQHGRVVAYERALSTDMTDLVKTDTHLAKMIGVWRGRQAEEGIALRVNRQLIDKLQEQYESEKAKPGFNRAHYVDIFNDDVVDENPVLRDGVDLLTYETRAYAREKSGGGAFYIRKDQLEDALGYRNASVGDAWTGITRWDPKVQDAVRNLSISLMGNNAYRLMVNAEKGIQGVVKDLKVLIVVKSIVVPAANIVSNIHHLAFLVGVPIMDIVRGAPRKLAEIQSYTKNRVREIELEAELRAAEGSGKGDLANQIRAERRAIEDANSRMSIWPLIQAGEFSAISDAGISRDEILLTSGRLNDYIEKKLQGLPEPLETMGRYALITRDTALFQGLQKAVDYGDFVAKAILYDHLTKKKGKTAAEALGRITEEFVNYDRLPGRFRGTLEDLGLLWFYNFKIRSVKVALSVIRNNPVHALLANVALPDPGSVLTDNVFSKAWAGGLPYSMGPGMGIRALGLNPITNTLF